MVNAPAPYSLAALLTAPNARVTPEDVLMWGALGLVVGLALFVNGFKWLKRKRLLENTPTSKARSVAMGRVEVYGTIVPFQEITVAPFSGTQCVYFYYYLEERHLYRDKDGEMQEGWSTIDSGRWSVPFFVQDETGQILVDVTEAEIDTPNDCVARPIDDGHLPPTVASHISLPRKDILRYSESYIRPGEQLFVLGFAGHNPHQAESTQESAAGGKMIQYRKGHPFFVSSKSHQDIVSLNGTLAPSYIVFGAIISTLGLIAVTFASTLIF